MSISKNYYFYKTNEIETKNEMFNFENTFFLKNIFSKTSCNN